MKFSIVIPNYNGAELLRKNLPKVFKAVDSNVEIIVVDDGSSDSSLDYLKTQPVKVLKNKKNMGFSSAVNKGVSSAKGDVVFLLNSDSFPEKDFLKPLDEDFKDPLVFAVGCLDKSLEEGKIILRGRGIGEWRRGLFVHSRGEIDKKNTLWASGGSSAFRKSIWQKLGGLNPIYNPFYWEDIDLSYRALKSGYKVLFEERSVIYHNHSQGAVKKNYSEHRIRRIAYRNQFIFIWENTTDFFLQIKHIFFLPYHFLKALLRLDLDFFIGFIEAFILLPRIINSSFKIQKKFTVSDRKVTEPFRK